MSEVTRTELNQQTARILGRVTAGERLTITDRGQAVAEIVPPSVSRWETMIASGTITPPLNHGGLPFDAVESETSTESTLSDLRTERA